MKNVEDLFAAESGLRSAAREFAGKASFGTAMDLRKAARRYATLADRFEDEPNSIIRSIESESST